MSDWNKPKTVEYYLRKWFWHKWKTWAIVLFFGLPYIGAYVDLVTQPRISLPIQVIASYNGTTIHLNIVNKSNLSENITSVSLWISTGGSTITLSKTPFTIPPTETWITHIVPSPILSPGSYRITLHTNRVTIGKAIGPAILGGFYVTTQIETAYETSFQIATAEDKTNYPFILFLICIVVIIIASCTYIYIGHHRKKKDTWGK